MADFRGYPACSCLIAWLPVYERMLLASGVLKEGQRLRVYQLIGGAPQSGGTHSTGGAFDLLDLPGEQDLVIARQMGGVAWSRKENWDNNGGMAHIHGVLRGCPHNTPARYQIDAADKGYNGLGKGGMAAPDDGPRSALSDITWRQGIAWANEQLEEDVPLTEAEMDRIAEKVVRYPLQPTGKEPWDMPAESLAARITRDTERSGRNLYINRELREQEAKSARTLAATRGEVAGLKAALEAMSKGLDTAAISKAAADAARKGAEAALKDVSLTLTTKA